MLFRIAFWNEGPWKQISRLCGRAGESKVDCGLGLHVDSVSRAAASQFVTLEHVDIGQTYWVVK